MKTDQETFKERINEKTERTIQELKKIGVENFYTNHCTGIDGFMKLKNSMKERACYGYTGSRIKL